MTDSNSTATIPAIVRERVARGLAWIIEHGAAHGVDLDRVDLDTLNISNPDLCVLGQGHGTDDETGRSGYSAVLSSLFGDDWLLDPTEDSDRWITDHGFADDYGYCYGAALTEAWRQAITVHRAQ